MREMILVIKNFNQLGKKVSPLKNPEKAVLEKVINPHKKDKYVIRFSIPEFTSLCPVTEQPDFAKIFIDYLPNNWILESKSLKLYIQSYRNIGIFHEDVTNKILDDFRLACKPRKVDVIGHFNPRGGISTIVEACWEE